jgi:hypothetical protein
MKKQIITFFSLCSLSWGIGQAMDNFEGFHNCAITPYELTHGHKKTLIIPYHILSSILTADFFNHVFTGLEEKMELRFQKGNFYSSYLNDEFSLSTQAFQIEKKKIGKEFLPPPLIGLTFKNSPYWNTAELSFSYDFQLINASQREQISKNLLRLFSGWIKQLDIPILYLTFPGNQHHFWSIQDESIHEHSEEIHPIPIQEDRSSIALSQVLSIVEGIDQQQTLQEDQTDIITGSSFPVSFGNHNITQYFNPHMFE